jgi:hypothetical protein
MNILLTQKLNARRQEELRAVYKYQALFNNLRRSNVQSLQEPKRSPLFFAERRSS